MRTASHPSALTVLLLAGLCVAGTSALQATPAYSVQILAGLGSGAAGVSAMNSSGIAAGFFTDNSGRQVAASFYGGNATTLGGAGEANGINNAGVVVGTTFNGLSPSVTEWANGQAMALGMTGYGMAINNGGEVAGSEYVSSMNLHAFTYAGGQVSDLGTLGGSWSSANALNDSGQVAGTSTLSNGAFRAFLSTGTGLVNLGTLGGANSYGQAISQNGEVAGVSQDADGFLRAFVSSGGPMQNLGTLGGSLSAAYGVNDSGWVVGNSLTGNNASLDAFLWMNGVMTDLNSLLPVGSGWTLTGAFAIDDADDILATATQDGRDFFAVDLTPDAVADVMPTPEPAAVALVAIGLILISRFGRKRAPKVTK